QRSQFGVIPLEIIRIELGLSVGLRPDQLPVFLSHDLASGEVNRQERSLVRVDVSLLARDVFGRLGAGARPRSRREPQVRGAIADEGELIELELRVLGQVEDRWCLIENS